MMGDTALTNAVRCNHSEIVNYLLEKVDPNGGKTKNSIKPILLARDKNFLNLENCLFSMVLKKLRRKLKEILKS